MVKTVEIIIWNRSGLGSHVQTVDFTTFSDLRSTVDELVEDVPFHKVTVELTPSWDATPEERKELSSIEEE